MFLVYTHTMKRQSDATKYKPGHIGGPGRLSLRSQAGSSQEVIPCSRLSQEDLHLISKTGPDGMLYTPDLDDKPTPFRLLRSTKKKEEKKIKMEDQPLGDQGYRVVNVNKMMAMMSTITSQHRREHPRCYRPDFAVIKSKKMGLGWSCVVTCTTCKMVSPLQKMYNEANHPHDSGPNPVDLNINLQAGLLDLPIGNTSARRLIASMDVEPPTRCSMQRTSNAVGKKVVTLNETVTREKVAEVKQIQKMRGLTNEQSNIIGVSGDGRYNTVGIGHSKKPGQGASQAVALLVENTTSRNYVLASETVNKLCWMGTYLRGQGYHVTCPGHQDCTANKNRAAPFNEKEMGQAMGDQLTDMGMVVSHITTDGDAKMAEGVRQSIKSLDPLLEVERYSDPYHLSKMQFKKTNSANFSLSMFTGRTKAEKKVQQTEFSRDMKSRCSLTLKSLREECSGDYERICKKLPFALEAIVRCYSGDCSRCRRHSKTCDGGVTNSWWHKSMFLGPAGIHNLEMNEDDKDLLRELLRLRLSVNAYSLVRRNTHTNINEGLNRKLSVHLPKNVNYSRNAPARVASCILDHNLGYAEAMQRKTEVCGTTLSPPVQQKMQQMTTAAAYHRKYQGRTSTKRRAIVRRAEHNKQHHQYRRMNPDEKTDYLRQQQDIEALRPDELNDHNYNM